MQLSTSFLPFDVAPAPAGSSTPILPAATAADPAAENFAALLQSEVAAPAADARDDTGVIAKTPATDDILAEDDENAVLSDDIVPASAQTPAQPAIAAAFTWSGFMGLPNATNASVNAADDSSAEPQFDAAFTTTQSSAVETGSDVVVATSTSDAAAVRLAKDARNAAITVGNAAPHHGAALTPETGAPAHAAVAGAQSATESSVNSAPVQRHPSRVAAENAPSSPVVHAVPDKSMEASASTSPRGSSSAANAVASAASAASSNATSSHSFARSDEAVQRDPMPGDKVTNANRAAATAQTANVSDASKATPASLTNRSADAYETASRATASARIADATSSADEASSANGAVANSTQRSPVSTESMQPTGVATAPSIADQSVRSVQANASPRLHLRRAAEKFAVSSADHAAATTAAPEQVKKESLEATQQLLAGRVAALGTNVAKPQDHMPVSTSLAASVSSVEGLPHELSSEMFESAWSEQGGDESTELTQVARRAVNAAAEIADQFSRGEKNSVTLKFSISGSELGVRVELRGEQLHTTFRTDSPELRAALAQEWQSVNGGASTERGSRLADPVFTSNPSANAAGSDASGADQRGSHARHGHLGSDEWSRYRASARSNEAAATSANPAPRATSSVAPGRLHTFA